MSRNSLKVRIPKEEALVKSYYPDHELTDKFQYYDDVVFNQEGTQFAIISEKKMITLFDTLKATQLCEIKNYKYKCTKVLFAPEDKGIFVNSFNETDNEDQHKARLLDVTSNQFIMYYPGPTGHITSMCCTSNILFTSSKDSSIRLHDISTGKTVSSINPGVPSDIALHPNGLCLAVSNDSKVQLYDVRAIDKGSVCSVTINLPFPVKPVFGPIGASLIVAGPEYMRLLSLVDLELIHIYDKDHLTFTGAVSFTPDEKFVLAATDNQKIIAFETNINDKAFPRSVYTCDSSVTGIGFSKKYTNFVTVGEKCTYWSVDMDILSSFIDI